MKRVRIHCSQCLVTACNLCGPHYFKQEAPVAPAAPARFFPQRLIQEQGYYIAWLEGEVERLTKEVAYYKKALQEQRIEEELDADFQELYNESLDRKGKKKEFDTDFQELYNNNLGKNIVGSSSKQEDELAGVLCQEKINKVTTGEMKQNTGQKLVKNMLYNIMMKMNRMN